MYWKELAIWFGRDLTLLPTPYQHQMLANIARALSIDRVDPSNIHSAPPLASPSATALKSHAPEVNSSRSHV